MTTENNLLLRSQPLKDQKNWIETAFFKGVHIYNKKLHLKSCKLNANIVTLTDTVPQSSEQGNRVLFLSFWVVLFVGESVVGNNCDGENEIMMMTIYEEIIYSGPIN